MISGVMDLPVEGNLTHLIVTLTLPIDSSDTRYDTPYMFFDAHCHSFRDGTDSRLQSFETLNDAPKISSLP